MATECLRTQEFYGALDPGPRGLWGPASDAQTLPRPWAWGPGILEDPGAGRPPPIFVKLFYTLCVYK